MRREQGLGKRRGVLDAPSQELGPRAPVGGKLYGPAVAENAGHAAEQLCAVHGRIFLGERIAAGGEHDTVARRPFAHHAVDEKATTEQEQNDFAGARLGNRFGAHGEQIAGINGGNHAAAVGHEAHFAEAVQNLGGEVQASFLLRLESVSVTKRACQEFLRLNRH